MEIVDSSGYVIQVKDISSVVIFAERGQTSVSFEQGYIRLAKFYGKRVEDRNYITVTCVDGSFYTVFSTITITSDIPFRHKTGKRIIVGIDGSVRVKILNYVG